jgi:predicted metalloprotease with PDZ domain
LQWTKKPLPGEASKSTVAIGAGLKEESGKLIITSVVDGSPAQAAGFAIDDEILAVDGMRTATTSLFLDTLAQAGDGPVTIHASCDGRIYTTRLSPQRKHSYTITIDENAGGESARLREIWLHR